MYESYLGSIVIVIFFTITSRDQQPISTGQIYPITGKYGETNENVNPCF